MKHIEEILPSGNRNVKLGGLMAFANAANNGLQFTKKILTVVEAVSIYLVNSESIIEIFKAVVNGEDIELEKQVARAIANASSHNQNG